MSEGLIDPGAFTRQYAFSQRNWHNSDEHMRSVRSDRYKLITNAYLDLPHGTAADIGKGIAFQELLQAKSRGTLSRVQQLLFTAPREALELYDLEADPAELINLANTAEYERIRDHLLEVLEKWRADTSDHPPEARRRADNVNRFTGLKDENAPRLPQLKVSGD
ncbi:MAG: hypothetical protein WA922_09655 [Pontixanthobacter sp.]